MRIRYLHIKNFRGIREARMEFPKQESVLCLIGAGDTTKTTILKAIEYALWPSWNLQVTTSDFYNCNLEEAIVIEVSVEDIPETLLRESKYGLYLRGSVLEEDDEPTEDEAFLTIQLTIDNSLEPIWNAISNGKDSKNISQADRQLMSVGYIGTEIRNQLNWGKGSVFSKFIDPRSTIRQNLCILEAKSREYGEFSELDEIKGKIEGVSSTYGVNIFGNINNRLVLKTSNALSAIEVFEDDKPLNQRGFGSKKLLNLGLQIDGNEASTVVLIDEIEIGLEPYRIRSLIRKFVNETKNRGQLIFTTHSPIALVEMNINQVLVVHSEDGKTEIVKAETGEASVDHKLQGMLRKYTEAFLSPKVVICEGKTEVGFLRAMDEWLFAKKDFYVAEGIEDLYDSLKKYGKRIIDRLMDNGILGEQTIAAHCIYVNQHEMDVLKETKTMVVHNPESNMGNACGCPPTMEIFSKGILTGLGTDGYTHDMIESYKVANILHKHHLCNANAAWNEVPVMLFENNAKIANRYFEKPLGILKEGAAADVIISDYIPLTPMNANNVNGHILFGMTGRSIVTTVANGKILMQDRKLTNIDEEQALARVREEAEKLWNCIGNCETSSQS